MIASSETEKSQANSMLSSKSTAYTPIMQQKSMSQGFSVGIKYHFGLLINLFIHIAFRPSSAINTMNGINVTIVCA